MLMYDPSNIFAMLYLITMFRCITVRQVNKAEKPKISYKNDELRSERVKDTKG